MTGTRKIVKKDKRSSSNKFEVIRLDIQWFLSPSKPIDTVVHRIEECVVGELREYFPNEIQNQNISLAEALSSINKATGKKFIIIIDEWDVLIRDEAEDTKIQKEYIEFLRTLFKGNYATGKRLVLHTETIYPVCGKIKITVDLCEPEEEEDPIAKNHLALRRGPIVLAQENRLGYSVDEPVNIFVGEDGYVDVTFPEKEVAPYKHILEIEVLLENGKKMHVTDYASAGKLWTGESKMAAWMLVENR